METEKKERKIESRQFCFKGCVILCVVCLHSEWKAMNWFVTWMSPLNQKLQKTHGGWSIYASMCTGHKKRKKWHLSFYIFLLFNEKPTKKRLSQTFRQIRLREINKRLNVCWGWPFFVHVLYSALLFCENSHKPGMGCSECQFSAFRGCDETWTWLERCRSVREWRHGGGVAFFMHETCYRRSKPVEEETAANLQWSATGVNREIMGHWGDSEVRKLLLPAEGDADEGAISERWTLVKKWRSRRLWRCRHHASECRNMAALLVQRVK